MKTLFFDHKFEYLDHAGMEKMLSSEKGAQLLSLARNISVCLHEDWKKNLIREKGLNYQHFRPIKDAAMERHIIENKEQYLSIMSEDGKPLYKIDEKTAEDGSVVYDVSFDLIRVPFENLSTKWQEANLDAAKFALCLVKTCIEQGALSGDPSEAFKNFERMAHDIHLEWMYREGSWADPKLLLPYELLTVDTLGHNQKDKDRAHIEATTDELTFQPNILARNRSIVMRAIEELFNSRDVELAFYHGKKQVVGLSTSFMKTLAEIKKFTDKQNAEDFARYQEIKMIVKKFALNILKEKSELTFADLEKLSAVYFREWKLRAKTIMKLPNELDEAYDTVGVDDLNVNHKTVAREEVIEILKDMINCSELSESFANSVLTALSKDSEIGQLVIKANNEDFANFAAKMKN